MFSGTFDPYNTISVVVTVLTATNIFLQTIFYSCDQQWSFLQAIILFAKYFIYLFCR